MRNQSGTSSALIGFDDSVETLSPSSPIYSRNMRYRVMHRGVWHYSRSLEGLRSIVSHLESNFPIDPWPTSFFDPIIGCDLAGHDCAQCYAARRIAREDANHPSISVTNEGRPIYNGKLFRARRRDWWKQGDRSKREIVFAFGMTDFFHPKVSSVDRLTFRLIAQTHRLKFYNLLTKRPAALRAWLDRQRARYGFVSHLTNVRYGVSASTNRTLAKRWPDFRDAEVPIRHLSFQPLLEEIVLPQDITNENVAWVVAMREVGNRPRPMRVEWIDSLRRQCQDRQIPFFWELTDYETPEAKHADMRAVEYLRANASELNISPPHLRALHPFAFAADDFTRGMIAPLGV